MKKLYTKRGDSKKEKYNSMFHLKQKNVKEHLDSEKETITLNLQNVHFMSVM